MTTPQFTLFDRGSWPEVRRVSHILREETVGGALLLAAALTALVWANSPWRSTYFDFMATRVGPSALNLNLSISTWAADGLLAIFFFVVGLELKREFVAGDLRNPARAALPIVAAIGGMVVPATVYALINVGDPEALRGWAVPTATDIAFAVAVLAVISTHLPAALRTFLLTLAVVDDLLAITVIAVFYTEELHPVALAAALIPLALFTLAVQRGVRAWWVLVPLAVATWVLVHESGVHATVAGVLLGVAVPVLDRGRGSDIDPDRGRGSDIDPDRGRGSDIDPDRGLAARFEHRMRPLSAGMAVPLFAFCAAGVFVGGVDGVVATLTDRAAIGVVAALVVGKALGIFGTTRLVAALTRARLHPSISWVDVLGVAMLAGVGFTVSLLIGDLAFGEGTERGDTVKVAVLVGSLTSATLAAIVLRLRNRAYRIAEAEETADDDGDGVPDVYQR